MGDTMHPVEHEGPEDYFWFDSPQPAKSPLTGEPDLFVVVWGEKESHPNHGYEAFIEKDPAHVGGDKLITNLPFGGNAEFDLASFPTDRWENLEDDAGKQIPLRILVHGGKVAGQWLPDPGITAPPPVTARPAPAEPDEAAVEHFKSLSPQVQHEMLHEIAAGPRESRPVVSLAAPDKPPEGGRPAIDRDFGGNGVVLASFQGGPCDARAMCVQPDGRVIVAGGVDRAGSGSDIAVVRFMPDGSLDEDFGDGGWVVIPLDGRRAVAHAVARQQADGKIVVAGESLDVENDRGDFVLVRLNRNGKKDAKFGVVLTDFGANSGANAVAIQDDGKIVAAGWCARPDALQPARPGGRSKSHAGGAAHTDGFALARYDKDGRLDDRFGERGLAVTQFAGGAARAYALAIQPDGELVAAGSVHPDPAETVANFACARYRTSGRLDQAFGTDGLVTITLTAAEDTARAVALQDGGKIVLAGTAEDRAAHESHFALVRLDAHGRLDESFNGKRAVVTRDIPGGASGVAIHGGAILAAGYATVRERDKFAIARYRDDGSLDPTFGGGGAKYLGLGGVIDRAHAIAIDPDQRILLAGTSRRSKTQKQFALARLLPGAH